MLIKRAQHEARRGKIAAALPPRHAGVEEVGTVKSDQLLDVVPVREDDFDAEEYDRARAERYARREGLY